MNPAVSWCHCYDTETGSSEQALSITLAPSGPPGGRGPAGAFRLAGPIGTGNYVKFLLMQSQSTNSFSVRTFSAFYFP